MDSTDTPLYIATTSADATISYGNKVSGDEVQHMPLPPTEKDLDWQTGIINMKSPSYWSFTKEKNDFNIFKVLRDKGSLKFHKILNLCHLY